MIKTEVPVAPRNGLLCFCAATDDLVIVRRGSPAKRYRGNLRSRLCSPRKTALKWARQQR
jgi:hypothetical protein